MTDHKNVAAGRQEFFHMSAGDLKKLGLEEVGYIRKYDMKGEAAWVLHAADGTALAVQKNPDAAHISAHHHDIDVVSLH